MVTANRYPGTCAVCGRQVEAEQGFYTRRGGLRHAICMTPAYGTRYDRIARKIELDERDRQSRLPTTPQHE